MMHVARRTEPVPARWIETTLGDAFTWGSGGTPLSTSPEYYDGDIPWAIIGDLNDGVVTSTARSITAEGLVNSSAKLLEPGSVLLAMYGSIGKLGIAGTRMATNQAIAFTKPVCCSPEYLFYYLMWARRELEQLGKGGTQQNISQTVIKAFPFRYPEDRGEQERIVRSIEEQLSRADAGVATLMRAEASLKRYRAAVLKAACEGRLVPTEAELAREEGRDYETGDELLGRIVERRRSSFSRRKHNESPSRRPDLRPLPTGWAWAVAGQVTEVTGGLTKNPQRSKFVLRVPYLRVANVYANELRLAHVEEIGVTRAELDRVVLQENDLLIVEGNGSPEQIGRVAKWDGSIAPCAHQNHLIKLRPREPSLSGWALYFLLSPEGRRLIGDISSSTSGLHTLSLGKVSALPIPLPPMAEQQRIVAEIERRLTAAASLESDIAASMRRCAGLRRSILRAAFQ